MHRFGQILEVELLLTDDISTGGDKDRVGELKRKLENLFDATPTTIDELNLQVSCVGMTRRKVNIGDLQLCHARISLEFDYQSEKPMPRLLQWQIIPQFYRIRLFDTKRIDFTQTPYFSL